MKVHELSGAKLDAWVARAMGWQAEQGSAARVDAPAVGVNPATGKVGHLPAFSFEWLYGGPIVQKEFISIVGQESKKAEPWYAFKQGQDSYYGSTPLEAAMRCYVASIFGDEVEERTGDSAGQPGQLPG